MSALEPPHEPAAPAPYEPPAPAPYEGETKDDRLTNTTETGATNRSDPANEADVRHDTLKETYSDEGQSAPGDASIKNLADVIGTAQADLRSYDTQLGKLTGQTRRYALASNVIAAISAIVAVVIAVTGPQWLALVPGVLAVAVRAIDGYVGTTKIRERNQSYRVGHVTLEAEIRNATNRGGVYMGLAPKDAQGLLSTRLGEINIQVEQKFNT